MASGKKGSRHKKYVDGIPGVFLFGGLPLHAATHIGGQNYIFIRFSSDLEMGGTSTAPNYTPKNNVVITDVYANNIFRMNPLLRVLFCFSNPEQPSQVNIVPTETQINVIGEFTQDFRRTKGTMCYETYRAIEKISDWK